MANQQVWQTTTTLAVLQVRAKVIGIFQNFFHQNGVLQVDTPTISQFANTDPSIESFIVQENIDSQSRFFLQTSPEFPMKRLLASGMGSIYQICKVFRSCEIGRYHNPEFTLLEWYRVEIDHFDLMDEMIALFSEINLEFPFYNTITKLSYQDLFLNYLAIDPLNSSIEELKNYIKSQSNGSINLIDNMNHNDLCDYLMSHMIQDKMPAKSLIFVFNYPATQASLAQINDDKLTARRFEVFASGIELANGFHELRDAQEQHQRFLEDQKNRAIAKQAVHPLDGYLIQALQHGLPDCAGVALGVERLLMLIVNAKHINEVLSFPFDRA
ncbi:Translation elongation factor P Lys34--(R)-beta-lysine ligase [hydrothermal vent metagenome]|uniref:Translation elongation factor P Lys34--(R)-beta-lysine ligase n=1 Tax=hydrothermal vent metagenome TaxID=652676 RepID=A0A3B1AG05_9ZZZZ